VAGGGFVVHTEVDRGGVGQEDEVAEGAGAVVAVDAVGVPGLVFFGRSAERALYRAGPSGPVDTAQAEDGRGEGAAEREAFSFEEAFATSGFGLGRGFLVYPLAVLLGVDAGARNEDEAPEILLRFEGREEVSWALRVGEPVGLVRGATWRGGVDDDVEVGGQGVRRQGFGVGRAFVLRRRPNIVWPSAASRRPRAEPT
jgi:hypothetical protein